MGCIVQEAVRVDRQAAKVFAKILPIMKHYVDIDFGVSQFPYGNKIETLGE